MTSYFLHYSVRLGAINAPPSFMIRKVTRVSLLKSRRERTHSFSTHGGGGREERGKERERKGEKEIARTQMEVQPDASGIPVEEDTRRAHRNVRRRDGEI